GRLQQRDPDGAFEWRDGRSRGRWTHERKSRRRQFRRRGERREPLRHALFSHGSDPPERLGEHRQRAGPVPGIDRIAGHLDWGRAAGVELLQRRWIFERCGAGPMTGVAARALPQRSRRDARGAAAVEFALIAPILCLLLAGAVDFGGALYTNLRLDTAVAAGANYAQVNAANVSSANGAALAANIANVVETSEGAV